MDEVENLLRTGSFRTSRSRSPNPRYDLPVRAKPEPTSNYRTTTRIANTSARRVRPPPPTVEDEAAALAKEHTDSITVSSHDDEPKNRGDVDQTPLLVPVPENNPERRFVIVTGAEGGTDSESAQSITSKTRYDANTGRKKVHASSSDEDGQEKTRRPELTKRKSHQDLPPIDTHPEVHRQTSTSRSNSRRNRERPQVSQESRVYSDRNDSARPVDDGYLSPEPIITHTNGGRERAYWDLNSAAAGGVSRRRSMRGDTRPVVSEERRSTANLSAGPAYHRRTASNAERPNLALNPLIAEVSYGAEDEALDFMMQDNDAPPRRSKRAGRSSNSPPYPPSEQDRRPSRSPSFKSRRQSFREQGQYYGDDSFTSQRSDRPERSERRGNRPPRPTLERDSSTLLSPDQAWPPTQNRSKSKSGGSPLPSPRATEAPKFPDPDDLPLPSPRSSTFPPERGSRRYDDRPVSPGPPQTGTSPPRRTDDIERRRVRADSRAATISNPYANSSSSVPVPIPIPLPVGRSDVTDRRPSPAPPSPTIPRHGSLESSSPTQHWQPPTFDPSRQQAPLLDKPITSYRRYSEDVQKGILPQLPDCSWKSSSSLTNNHRRASEGVQFLTLPRANFNICSDCHAAVFANTEFGRLFIPITNNRPDQAPLSCDFGSSPWYRIAYLMTLKSRFRDLHLLQDIASVASREQACAGPQPAARIWYTLEPRGQRPVTTFSACKSCAKMVEALLPNLAGIFVPFGSPSEPSRGICSLHFTPDRKRFTDYFDTLETASERAQKRMVPVDIADLADQIRALSKMEECSRGNVVADRKWNVMPLETTGSLDFTVCDECFDEVVWHPLMRGQDRGSAATDIPWRFYSRRKELPSASCMLWSDRMREVFRRACRRDDPEYLEYKILEKVRAEREIKARIAELEAELREEVERDNPYVLRELVALKRRLTEVE